MGKPEAFWKIGPLHDRIWTISLLSIGTLATALVVLQSIFWRWQMGPTVDWALPWTLVPQLAIYVATAALCFWRLRFGREAWPFALGGGILATAAFWIAESAAIVALPCPSFC